MSFSEDGKKYSDSDIRRSLRELILNSPLNAPIREPSIPKIIALPPVETKNKFLHSSLADEEAQRRTKGTVATQQTYKEMKGFLNPPTTLLIFKKIDHLLVKRNDDLVLQDENYNSGVKYEVFDGETETDNRIFIAAQLDQSPKKFCSTICTYPYVMAVFDSNGTEIFKLEGESANCGTFANVQIQDRLLRFGEIIRANRGNTKFFEIHDSAGEQIFEIKASEGPHSRLGEYNISTNFGEVLVGRITSRWDKINNRTASGVFGMRFTKEVPVELKALLLGSAITIDYRFFEKY